MRYDTLTADQNAKLAATIRDLEAFVVGGISILRGKANAVEEAALSKLANPGKTKHLDRDDRGILAIQKQLDRAQTLMRMAIGSAVESYNFHIDPAAVPRDACIQARNGEGDNAVKATWQRDWTVVQSAKTIWLAMRNKYSEEQLASPGTLTLEGKKRKAAHGKAKSDLAIFTALRKAFPGNNIAVLEEMAKYEADPVNYKLPETSQPEATAEASQPETEVVQVAAQAIAQGAQA